MFQEIEDYYQAEDGDDWLPAVMRAQLAVGTPSDPRGGTLNFRPKEYRFSNSIPLIRRMSIVGSGAAISGTVLRFPAEIHGIICHGRTTAPSLTPGDGVGSIVERVIITSRGDSPVTAHGVIMHARMNLRDVVITQFSGNGIHIDANLEATPSTEASLWQVQNCSIDSCHDGLYVHGPDANAGCAISLDCRDNRGWGINDESFLGNTYIACHTNANLAGAYRCSDPSARSMFLNCYAEGGQPESQIQSPSIVLGGMISIDATCKPMWLHPSGFMNPIRGVSWRGTGTPLLGASLGTSGGVNSALELHRFGADMADDPHPYRFQYGYTEKPGWWELIYANLGTTPFRFSTKEADVGHSQVWMENGFYLGRAGGRRRVWVGDGPRTDPTETWTKGDRILNSDPSPGGWSGWICITSGSPGTWLGFGRIQE